MPTALLPSAIMAISQSKVPRSELVEEAYDRLRDLIVSGRLAPGAPIIETEVAALLGVNRSHLRTALQRLQHEGFVLSALIGTYSRSRVAPLTLDDVKDLFSVVGALEGVAARRAAQLPPEARMGLVGEMKRTNAALLAAAAPARRDYDAANRMDLEFHRSYVEAAGGPRVRSLHAAVRPQADRYERFYASTFVDQVSSAAAEHDAVIAGIEAGDADAAQRAVEVNWRNAAERFRRVMEVAGERGSA